MDEKLHARVARLLSDEEEVEAAVSGIYGTLPGGGYSGPAIGAASFLNPFAVALTNRRLIAARQGVRGLAHHLSLESDRATSHVEIKRTLPLFGTWTQFVFHDRELKLLVGRRSRDELERIRSALEA